MYKHLRTKEHFRSIGNAAVKKYKKEMKQPTLPYTGGQVQTKDGKIRAAGKKVRLIYTMIIRHIPLCDDLYLTRLINSFMDDADFKAFGHCTHECQWEIVRIIANDLRGLIEYQHKLVQFVSCLLDGSTNVRRFAYTCEWIKYVFPPANPAAASGIPRSPSVYKASEQAIATFQQKLAASKSFIFHFFLFLMNEPLLF
jgi:hypothetical protein